MVQTQNQTPFDIQSIGEIHTISQENNAICI